MVKPTNNSLLVNEMFASIAGEGLYAGKPNFFIRLVGCNLYCSWKGVMGTSMCDSIYASHPSSDKEIKYRTVDETFEAFQELMNQYPKITQLTITGGEPLLQREGVKEFLKRLPHHLDVSFETNGTQLPINTLFETDMRVDLWTVSPKLSSSCYFVNSPIQKALQEKHKKERINVRALYEFTQLQDAKCIFKFVAATDEDIQEIKEIINKVTKYTEETYPMDLGRVVDFFDENVYIMPCGETEEKLQKSRLLCVEACKENGWTYTDRLQIIIYGDKRGV